MSPFRLATRSSRLALWQARHVAALLRRAHPGLHVTLVPIVSSGDVDRATPLFGMGTQGIFVKEVQQAVIDGRADAAVHSCKDVPTAGDAALTLAAMPRRADVRDALVGAPSLAALPRGALIGTSSLRRQAQIAALRSDLRFAPIRGNVETRIRKVQSGEFAATILAMAGLHRLGLLRSAGAVPLDPLRESVPDPAQGAIAIECRTADARTRRLLAALNHRDTAAAVRCERAVLAALRGGCSLPLGCWVRRDRDGTWQLDAFLSRDLGGDKAPLRVTLRGPLAGLAERAAALLTSNVNPPTAA